ncbi:MAG TPA: glycosyltransferase [Acidimicrobiales bacterium]|nr:glycosyltransferase [Acidimicrobiales bacterium]
MTRVGREAGSGVVSVVVLDDGDEDALRHTLEGLGACDCPASELEVVIVTGTPRGLADRLAVALPRLRVVGADGSPTARRNRGAEAAEGEWLAFLGVGLQPERAWLREAVGALRQAADLAGVASLVLGPDGRRAWDPTLTYSLRAGSGAMAERGGEVLYASAAAAVLRAEAFAAVDGFDETYGDLLDDVDLGWRLWLSGRRVVFLQTLAVRRIAPLPAEGADARFLRERNALFTVFKNYDDTSLAAALPAALAMGLHRAAVEGGDEIDHPATASAVSAPLAASARAAAAFTAALPDLVEARRRVQEGRVRSDVELFRLLELPGAAPADGRHRSPDAAATEALGVGRRFGTRRRVVVATCDALTPRMAGPAIRALQIAGALAAEHDVQLVTTSVAAISDPRFPVRAVDDSALAQLERWCDVLLFQGWLITGRPFLLSSEKVLVADVYDPLHLEQLEQAKDGGADARRHAIRSATQVLNEQLMRGDFFLCASPKQRDFWLGQLAAVGRINPRTYDEDATLRSLIGVVPFGISDTPPEHTRPAIKGVFPGIGAGDKVVLWGGGIYNWFDPLTLLRAVDRLRQRQPDVRLLFMGLRHPNPDIPEMRMAVAARALSDELGLTDTHVFFNEEWVAYDDRQNYLLEADIGVSTHLAHLETALSSRTRILDYLWASLPVVATEGDVLSDLVAQRGLGLTVPAGDVDALEAALFRLLDDEGFRKTCGENVAAVAPELTWSRVLQPLVEFCRRPRRAPDLLDAALSAGLRHDLGPEARRRGWRNDVRVGLGHLRAGGPALVVGKAWGRLRRRLL